MSYLLPEAYLARKSCGCVVGVVVNDQKSPQDTEQCLAEFVAEGLVIEEVTVDVARKTLRRCKCGTQMGLAL